MAHDDLHVLNQPACRHLRSKGMYVTGRLNPSVDDPEVGDGYCWCNKTQHMIGPDDGLVDRASCAGGRTCYESIV